MHLKHFPAHSNTNSFNEMVSVSQRGGAKRKSSGAESGVESQKKPLSDTENKPPASGVRRVFGLVAGTGPMRGHLVWLWECGSVVLKFSRSYVL